LEVDNDEEEEGEGENEGGEGDRDGDCHYDDDFSSRCSASRDAAEIDVVSGGVDENAATAGFSSTSSPIGGRFERFLAATADENNTRMNVSSSKLSRELLGLSTAAAEINLPKSDSVRVNSKHSLTHLCSDEFYNNQGGRSIFENTGPVKTEKTCSEDSGASSGRYNKDGKSHNTHILESSRNEEKGDGHRAPPTRPTSSFSIASLLAPPPRSLQRSGRRPHSKYPPPPRVQGAGSKSFHHSSVTSSYGKVPVYPITQPIGFQVERLSSTPSPSDNTIT